MANRLTKITTRTGDDGTTGLGDGTRIRKDALRVGVLGEIDELNSAIGVILTESLSENFHEYLTAIQNHLFDLGGEICIPGYRAITLQHVAYLDECSGALNANLPPLKEFILPGGCRTAALVQVARAVARRAERSLVAMANPKSELVSAESMQYLNRLSDFLFILARSVNRAAGVAEPTWQRNSGLTVKTASHG